VIAGDAVGFAEDDRVQVQGGPVRGDGPDAGGVPVVGLDEQNVGREVFGVVAAGIHLGHRVDAEGVE
jgi:hypothetical protein